MKKINIVIDTNVLICIALSNNPQSIANLLWKKLLSNNYEILTSEEQIREFKDVILREKFDYISLELRISLLEKFLELSKWVNVCSHVEDCRDTNDNYLLNLSIDGAADYLISQDKDLLVLKPKYKNTQIVDPREFLNG